MGKLVVPGLPDQVYLAKDNQVYTIKQGDILDGIYKVERVDGNTLTLLYLPLKQTQTLAIGRE
jgi:hypothetical protein